jgi:hypothetical protein
MPTLRDSKAPGTQDPPPDLVTETWSKKLSRFK